MKRILIISFSPINRDPRVMRQIRLLEDSYLLTVAGYGIAPKANINYIELKTTNKNKFRRVLFAFKLSFRFFEHYYWNTPPVREMLLKLNGLEFDLIIANDISALPLALAKKNSGKVLFDAHEYAPRQFEDRLIWRVFFKNFYDYLCKRYLSKADGMVTVCQGIADEYLTQYNVSADLVYNTPVKQNLLPSYVSPQTIRLIHHGLASPSRNLELTIKLMDLLDERFTLDFMLISSDPEYMRTLQALAVKNPRIRFVPPVAMSDICSVINAYDIGIFLLPPVNFNYKNALPNKFFEFIQARLAVAIGPSPEMARLVNQYSCGVVASSFKPQALADCLNALTPERLRDMKDASDISASELNYSHSSKVMLEKIEYLLVK